MPLRTLSRWDWLFTLLLGALAGWLIATVIAVGTGMTPLPGTTTDPLQLPKAPTSPDGRTSCPDGWRSTAGVVPPDAVQQLNPQHAGARSFYVCRKDAFEVTIWDNGFISGYEGNNPLTQEQAREVLKR